MYELSHTILGQDKYKDDTKSVDFLVDDSKTNQYPILIRATHSFDVDSKIYLPVDMEIFGFVYNQALLNCIVNAIDSKFNFDTIIESEKYTEIGYKDNISAKYIIIRSKVNIVQVNDGATLEVVNSYGQTDIVSDDINFDKCKSFKITLTRFEIMQLIKFFSEFQKKMYS